MLPGGDRGRKAGGGVGETDRQIGGDTGEDGQRDRWRSKGGDRGRDRSKLVCFGINQNKLFRSTVKLN